MQKKVLSGGMVDGYCHIRVEWEFNSNTGLLNVPHLVSFFFFYKLWNSCLFAFLPSLWIKFTTRWLPMNLLWEDVHCLKQNDEVLGVAETIVVDETIGNSYIVSCYFFVYNTFKWQQFLSHIHPQAPDY